VNKCDYDFCVLGIFPFREEDAIAPDDSNSLQLIVGANKYAAPTKKGKKRYNNTLIVARIH